MCVCVCVCVCVGGGGGGGGGGVSNMMVKSHQSLYALLTLHVEKFLCTKGE